VEEVCYTYTYNILEGNEQTNSEDMCNCCVNFIEFMLYAGSDTCGVGNGKLIYNLMTTDCEMVEESFGTTYQILMERSDALCSQGAFGSTITEEQCNDRGFLPDGGSWPDPPLTEAVVTKHWSLDFP
jgi:hypothetical protein